MISSNNAKYRNGTNFVTAAKVFQSTTNGARF